MPITINYGPAMQALQLAQIAGEGQARQANASRDLALLQFSLAQQRQNAEIEAHDKAFALQTAMAARAANTPTARAKAAPSLRGLTGGQTSLQRFGLETALSNRLRRTKWPN